MNRRLTIEEIIHLVRRAGEAVPQAPAKEVLLSAALMAETIEIVGSTKPAEAGPAKLSYKRLTANILASRGLNYPSVAHASWDLVTVQKKSLVEAAKLMGCRKSHVRDGIWNYRHKHLPGANAAAKPSTKAGS